MPLGGPPPNQKGSESPDERTEMTAIEPSTAWRILEVSSSVPKSLSCVL